MDLAQVLIVDDHADDELAKLRTHRPPFQHLVRHPQDVTAEDIASADVAVVDFRLDVPWPERDERETISLKPMDGLALSAVLKSHDRRERASPTAFVLRSAHLNDLSAGYPPDSRLHVIAAQNDLEWVIDKQSLLSDQFRQISSLASAVARLPGNWTNPDNAPGFLREWLRVPSEPWNELAWQDIEDCHPPLQEMSQQRHGLRVVRWLSQRILPYPCFLWTESRIAARLKVTHASFRSAIGATLGEVLEPARYLGALHDFDGHNRWWHRGIEAILWQLTDGQSFDTEVTIRALNKISGQQLERINIGEPVMCLTTDLRYREDPCDVANAVRLQPDYWPAYAESAWASLDDARDDDRLRAVVISADRQRLDGSPPSEG